MEPLHLLLSLDDVYDTRFSLMNKINPHAAIAAVRDGYGTRLSDHIIWRSLKISEEAWRSKFRQRDDEVLVRSVRSKMYNLLLEFYRDADQNPRDNVKIPNLSITVNEWPYALSKEVQAAQREVMHHFLPPTVPIHFVRRNPKQLTPKYLAGNFSHVVMYDFAEWCLLHENTEEPGNLLQITFVLPSILKELPTSEEGEEFKDVIAEVGIMGMVERSLAPVLNLRFVEIDYWNVPN